MTINVNICHVLLYFIYYVAIYVLLIHKYIANTLYKWNYCWQYS